MKVTAFWVMVPCSLVEVDWCFRGVYCLHHQDDKSELSDYFNETTWHHIPKAVIFIYIVVSFVSSRFVIIHWHFHEGRPELSQSILNLSVSHKLSSCIYIHFFRTVFCILFRHCLGFSSCHLFSVLLKSSIHNTCPCNFSNSS
jgi:hypothetical protein